MNLSQQLKYLNDNDKLACFQFNVFILVFLLHEHFEKNEQIIIIDCLIIS